MFFLWISLEKNMYIIRENNINRENMFYFLLKIMVCVLVVFGIHTVWQTVQDHCVRPRIKNTNAEIEKYKSLVESISQQNKSRDREEEEEKRCKLPQPEEQMNTDIESDLNSFLDSILVENHIEIIPVIM
jgi:glucan phosphoethanolaminetransferase (alkaline phosphatase superfamily)